MEHLPWLESAFPTKSLLLSREQFHSLSQPSMALEKSQRQAIHERQQRKQIIHAAEAFPGSGVFSGRAK
jgi:hypothetical protein